MEQNGRIAAVARHAAPLAANLGVAVWGVEIVGDLRPVVRLYVEAPSPVPSDRREAVADGAGVDIEQCAELSRRLGLALEVDDLFPGAWTLEVSSPGFERPFFQASQLPPYLGRDIAIILAAPLAGWPGRKHFRGSLCAVDGEQATLRLDASQRRPDEPERVDIPWACVRKAHLVHIFEDPERPGKKKSGPPRGGRLTSDDAPAPRRAT
jgi:ribosome maturation factor RimP